MPRVPKTCVICMKDCAGSPRVKDRRGRYYHRTCFQKMRRELLPVKDGAKRGPVKSVPIVEMIDGMVSSPAEPALATDVCPSCAGPLAAQAILCTQCGYNRVTGRRLTTVVEPAEQPESGRGAASRGFAYLNKQPWVVGLGWIAVYIALFLLATTWNPYSILAHSAVLFIHGLLIAIRTIRVIFEDGIVEGVLSCLLFSILFSIFPFLSSACVSEKTDNPHLESATIACAIGMVLLFFSVLLVGLDYGLFDRSLF